ncbi:DUF6099 family protein [Streptomyces sp. NPDC101132]|uniref:DUF6099 family protein n=1 Tax=Streptomyces sp. NPDC101132 TaxID=3366110 RepID=UPI00380745AD
MDAVRLIAAGRHALARSRTAGDTMAEALQAQALAQEIGSWLAVNGPPELRTEARGLGDAGRKGRATIERRAPGPEPGGDTGPLRADQLSGMEDLRQVFLGLIALLDDTVRALTTVACAPENDHLYWHIVETIDTLDHSCDRVRVLLRRHAARRGSASPTAGRGR